jgi:hypothetical protein
MKRLLIANRGIRALARGWTDICPQGMSGPHHIARHAQREAILPRGSGA